MDRSGTSIRKLDMKNSGLKNSYISPLFHHKNPEISLNFSFLYFLILTQFSILHFLIFYHHSHQKWSLAYLLNPNLIFILIFTTFFVTPTHQKITSIKILSIFKKILIWSSKIAKKPSFISPPNFHRTIYHLSYPK